MNQSLRSHSIRFGIGAFAGLCATLGPVMSAGPAHEDILMQTLTSTGFIAYATIMTIAVAIAAAILFVKSPLDVGQMFMTALGLPAIIFGSVNVNWSASKLSSLENEISALAADIAALNGLRYYSELEISPFASNVASGREEYDVSKLWRVLFPPAHAGTVGEGSESRLVAQRIGRNYVVVLGVVNTQADAQALVAQWRSVAPSATFIQHNTQYWVIDSHSGRSATNALRDAQRIRADAAGQDPPIDSKQVGIRRL